MKRTWDSEFGQSYAVPKEITERYQDDSWHNDQCPSFSNGAPLYVRLWVEHPEVSKREDEWCSRYSVTVADDAEMPHEAYAGDDLTEAMRVMDQEINKLKERMGWK
jgi:hypothetical protein